MGGRGGGGAPPDTTEMYKILGVDKKATDAEIKKAYRKLAVKNHPDKGGDVEEFKKIQGAYEVGDDVGGAGCGGWHDTRTKLCIPHARKCSECAGESNLLACTWSACDLTMLYRHMSHHRPCYLPPSSVDWFCSACPRAAFCCVVCVCRS